MFRTRRRQETPSAPTAQRGAVGSARVWDERTRADRAGPRARATPGGASESRFSALELAGLVRAVVRTTLEARLPDCPDEQRTMLACELELRLLELFAPRATPASEAQPLPQPASSAQEPPPQTERARDAPPATAAVPAPEPRARLLDLALEDRLNRLGSPTAARADLRDRLVALALERLASAAPEPNASPDDVRNLDVLQRRTAKLEQALAEVRAALAYVADLEYVDPGEASLYRTVQGLAPEDPRRAQKSAALECIFRANLSLQKPGA